MRSSLPRFTRSAAGALAALFCLAWPWPPALLAQSSVEWRRDNSFRQQLSVPVDVTWSQNPLRTALRSLATSQQIAIFLDRRIDPDQPIELVLNEIPLEETLERIASRARAEVGHLAAVAYIGPPSIATRLTTLAAVRRQQAARLPENVRQRLLRERPWDWPALITPRELVEQLSRESGLNVADLELLPHDLWPDCELPPLAWSDRMLLVLAGFNLSFELAGDYSGVRLVPLPEKVELVRPYRVSGDPNQVARKLAAQFPQVRVERSGGLLNVAGSAEEHYRIGSLLEGRPIRRTRGEGGEKRYRLHIQNTPLGAVLKTIASQVPLQVEIESGAEPLLQQLVSIHVDQATLDELLHAALDAAGLEYKIDNGRLIIRRSQNS